MKPDPKVAAGFGARPPGQIAVLGSLNMDLVVTVPVLPAVGETVLGDRLVTTPGGKGANQAVAAARLGGVVRMVGRVGADIFGEQLLRALAADGVNVADVARDADAPTGAALIVVEAGGQNMITVAPGANSLVGEREVERLQRGLVKGDVVVLQLEVPVDAVDSAFALARQVGATVILNAGPSRPIAARAVPYVDLLILNAGEAAILTGIPARGLEAAKEAARTLGEIAGGVVVTVGANGAVLWQDGQLTYIDPLPVSAVDSTAAGDAFVGATALGLATRLTMLEAVRLGSAAGAAAVTRVGARASLPNRQDLERLFGLDLSRLANFPAVKSQSDSQESSPI